MNTSPLQEYVVDREYPQAYHDARAPILDQLQALRREYEAKFAGNDTAMQTYSAVAERINMQREYLDRCEPWLRLLSRIESLYTPVMRIVPVPKE